MKKLLLLSVLILCVGTLFAECEFMGMVSKAGFSTTWEGTTTWGDYKNPESPIDFMDFLQQHSNSNDDGWGILAYKAYGELEDINFPYVAGTHYPSNHSFYPPDGYSSAPISFNTDDAWFGVDKRASSDSRFYHCKRFLFDNPSTQATERGIILGHVRNGTGGTGAHPFIEKYNGKTYTFMHNGNVASIKNHLFDLVKNATEHNNLNYPANQGGNPSQWAYSGMNNVSRWIDSELLFKFIMNQIKAVNGNVLLGLHNALHYDNTIKSALLNPTQYSNKCNIVISDGKHIYAFVNYRYGNEYQIAYKKFDNFYGLVTEKTPQMACGWQQIRQNQLVVISRHGITKIDNFLSSNPSNLVLLPDASGVITQASINAIPASKKGYITANANFGTFNLVGKNLYIAGTHTINTHGFVTISQKGVLTLNHGCLVNIKPLDSISQLGLAHIKLTENARILGNVPKSPQYNFNVSSNNLAHKSTKIPGDRIIVSYCGALKTNPVSYYNADNPRITITSEQANGKWDGIYYEYMFGTEAETTYPMLQCDISNLENFVIADYYSFTGKQILPPYGYQRTDANVSFYATNFTNVDNFMVKDGNIITFNGHSLKHGYGIFKSKQKAVSAFKSKLIFKNATIGGSNANGSYDGVYVKDSNGLKSEFTSCLSSYNERSNFTFENALIRKFKYVNAVNSPIKGIYCTAGTRFVPNIGDPYGDEFSYVKIAENYYVDFRGIENQNFKMDAGRNITLAYNGNYNLHKYLSSNWVSGNATVNVQGTNLTEANDASMCYPTTDAAWLFADERSQGSDTYFSQNNFLRAKAEAYYLIENNPDNEATKSALYNLYHMAALNQNFDELKQNLSNIQNQSLYLTAQSILAKIDISENNYTAAIAKTQNALSNAYGTDRLQLLADQGFAYLNLSNQEKQSITCDFMPNCYSDYYKGIEKIESSMLEFEENQKPLANQTPQVKNLVANNYPNPFNPSTKISFTTPKDGKVCVEVFNLKGQKVNTLVNEFKASGTHEVWWQGTDSKNNNVASGVYFYKVKTANKCLTKKMLLLK